MHLASRTYSCRRVTAAKHAINLHRQCTCCCSQSHTAAGSSSSSQGRTAEAEARVAVEGDTVTVHYKCMNPKGEIVETSDSNEPLTFEVGAGEIFGNKMFQAFDAGVRGLHIGEKTYLEASGGEWNKDLLFNVPRQHEEVQRLEGRYKNVGGLKEGLVVELANGSNAMVLDVKDDVVQLDANNMMAGQILMFELELVSIDPRMSGSTP
ncbi:hypothetical protein WJX77_006944 [Trebouxia sp. C0004]